MIPKYQHIADRLRAGLTDDGPERITKLPTEKELCQRYQVSRQTVRQALHLLETEGLISRRQGSGAYATGLHPEAAYNQIAVLLPSDSDYTYARLRSDLQAPLSKEGFSVSVYVTEHSVAKEREILSGLIAAPIRGLIVDTVKNALPNPNLDLYERLWHRHLPTVFLHTPYENFPPRIAITEDNFAGAALLTHDLIGGKHTRLGGIFRGDTREGFERYSGFVHACADAGLMPDDHCIGWYDTEDLLLLQKKQATGFLTDFIRQKFSACSAIVCQDDEIAYWLVKELLRQGIHVPDDISVVSFDNSFLCNFSTPTLTSLALHGNLASYAADALLAQLRGRPFESVRLSYELIHRDSSLILT